MTSKTTDNLSLDLGNAFSNSQTSQRSQDWRSIMAPLSSSNRVGKWTEADRNNVMCYEGDWWCVGDRCYTLAPDAIQENTSVGRYISEWYKKQFAFALHKAFIEKSGSEVEVLPGIVSSIPASLFKIKAEAELVRDNLAGEYAIGTVDKKVLYVTVSKSQIVLIPEGLGTFFGFLFGDEASESYTTGTWMIADVGYLTLDAVFIRNGEYVSDMARSDERSGISTVADQVRDYVFSKSRTRLDRAQIDSGMRANEINVNGKPLNIVKPRSEALGELGDRISLLLSQWASGQNLSGIILTGGGADYLRGYIQADNLPDFTLARNPRRANVEGGYLYLIS